MPNTTYDDNDTVAIAYSTAWVTYTATSQAVNTSGWHDSEFASLRSGAIGGEANERWEGVGWMRCRAVGGRGKAEC